jgi:hypothetical protein
MLISEDAEKLYDLENELEIVRDERDEFREELQ